MIAFAKPILDFVNADSLEADPERPGRFALKLVNGKYLSVNPDKTTKEADNVGPFESAKKVGSDLVYNLYADFGHPEVAIVVPIKEGL